MPSLNKNTQPILITGGNGQLAMALKAMQPAALNCLFLSKNELNITQQTAIDEICQRYQPSAIINTAAYTLVDAAEDNSALSHQVNHHGAAYLANASERFNIPLIHLSTDYVFDGLKQTPYREDDTPNPMNEYGKSKWLGEEAVRRTAEKHIILRVSGVFSEYGHNFFKTMLKLDATQQPLSVVSDQITCPTDARQIASVIFKILMHPALQDRFGTYHYAGLPAASWHAFASFILQKNIQPITTKETHRKAKRPLYSCLNCDKIQAAFGIMPSSWQQAVNQLMQRHPVTP